MLIKYSPKIFAFLFLLASLILPAASYSQEMPSAAARITGYWYLAEDENLDQSTRILFYFDPAEGLMLTGRLKAETGEFEAIGTRKIRLSKDLLDKIEMVSDDDGSASTCVFQDDDQIACRDTFSPDREARLKRLNRQP